MDKIKDSIDPLNDVRRYLGTEGVQSIVKKTAKSDIRNRCGDHKSDKESSKDRKRKKKDKKKKKKKSKKKKRRRSSSSSSNFSEVRHLLPKFITSRARKDRPLD